jgi:hypothetical protein
MLKQIVCVLLIASGFAISLVGCGNDTSGSISMSSPTFSNGVATAKATYSPAGGSALQHQKITFYWRTVVKSSGVAFDYPPSDSYTDSTGTASSDLILPSPRTDALIVYVEAKTGDLTTGMQSVDAPL